MWLDLNSDTDVVAPCAGKIVLKVSRLASGGGGSTGASTSSAPRSASAPLKRAPVAPVAAAGGLDSFFSTPTGSAASTPRGSPHGSSGDLLGELMGAHPAAAAPQRAASGGGAADPFGFFG